MTSVSQVEQSLKHILEERANVLARETGCIERQRNFSGADLLQTLVFGWLSHPDASLETLASLAATREVQATDTAIHKRFTRSCARFLHAILEEMTGVVWIWCADLRRLCSKTAALSHSQMSWQLVGKDAVERLERDKPL